MKTKLIASILFALPSICSAEYSDNYNTCIEKSNGSTPDILNCIYIEQDNNNDIISSIIKKNDNLSTIVDSLAIFDKNSRDLLNEKCSIYKLIYRDGQASRLLEEQCHLDGIIEIKRYVNDVIDMANFELGTD
ncbi:hypothetical protein [Vibrio coralliilyticus]|uniref:hypothetical protein n=1 Tax=Vibrio coralliilyticus TaxID=190893 RepID=UPI000380ECF5|nr:hypothetical protein [Vibrio coralliilyticus]